MAEIKTRNIHIEALSRNLGAPSLDGLAYALRHPETWPKGFVWDFGDCKQCAMGLAHALWDTDYKGPSDEVPDEAWIREYVSRTARLVAMPLIEAKTIFASADGYDRAKTFLGIKIGMKTYTNDQVTPEMVADAIDAYIARAE